MDPYVTEEQQVEAIKKWWKSNGSSVIVGVLIGLAIVLGWQYWTAHHKAQSEQASLQYHDLVSAGERADSEKIRQQGQALIERFPESFYSVLAAFELAKLATTEGDLPTAVARLQWVAEHADQEAVKNIARLRLARTFLARGRLEEAQVQLDQVNSANFSAELEELKGDLFVAQKAPDKARLAYQAALAANSSNRFLRMKLDDLAISGPAQE